MISSFSNRWDSKLLGELCRIELGKTPSRGEERMWDLPKETSNVWLSIADLPNSTHAVVSDSKEYISDFALKDMKIIPAGTLLVSFKLTLGRLAVAGRDLYSNEAIAALHDVKEDLVDKTFLYWALRHFDWDKAAEGDQKVKGKTLNKAKLKLIPIPLPPLDEQKRIVSILDQAFEGLDRARTNAEANLASISEFYGARLKQILTPGYIEETANCRQVVLSDICENIDSRRIPITKSDRVPGKIPYYGASGIVDYVDDFIFDEPLLLVSEDGANLISRTYPIAFSVYGKSWVNNHAHVLRFENACTRRFVEIYLNSISLEDYVSGAAQPKLNQNKLSSIPIEIPDLSGQSEVVSAVEIVEQSLNELTAAYYDKVQSINFLQLSLLQKAFSGELT